MSLVEKMNSIKKKTYSDKVGEVIKEVRNQLPTSALRQSWRSGAKSYFDYTGF